MKEKYFYYRDKNRRPMVTVCEIEGVTGVGRGVAICSLKDNPSKKIGRLISKGRANKALKDNLTFQLPINRREAITSLMKTNFSPDSMLADFKSVYEVPK